MSNQKEAQTERGGEEQRERERERNKSAIMQPANFGYIPSWTSTTKVTIYRQKKVRHFFVDMA